jgi:hypothetical protein
MKTFAWTSLLLALASVLPAHERPQGSDDSGGQAQWGDSAEPLEPFSEPGDLRGILLVGDQYIGSPQRMHVENGQLSINDVPVRSIMPDEFEDERPRGRRSTADRRARMLGELIAGQLVAVQTVIVLDDQPLIVLSSPLEQIDVLRRLARIDAAPALRPVSHYSDLPYDLDHDVWNRWLAEFSPTPQFVARAREQIALFEKSERAAIDAVAATRRLRDWSYPLSLFGMVTAVLGFGHLLSHRPPVGARSLDMDASPLAVSVLTWSLVLVVLYSALDLTWTILAHQAGQMQELNPLGSQLIEDPVKLMGFKAGATALSVGLLFFLRKYCKAQLAAWWICLILTLLTARWLMMSSMFVV